MIQFKPFPVFVNHSNMDAAGVDIENDFFDKGDTDMYIWMDNTGRQLLETTQFDRKNQSAVSIAYEDSVIAILNTIAQTKIGRLLFNSLRKDVMVWIVPFYQGLEESCRCAAATTPGIVSRKKGGGVRLHYDPSGLIPNGASYTQDDILFHELVHAYRSGLVDSGGQKWGALPEYRTAEELLAIQMQNMYLDARCKTKFYQSHTNPRLVSKGEAYSNLISRPENIMALKYFLNNVGMARIVAGWGPANSYNPWRDFRNLERMGINGLGTSGITSLPSL